MASQRELLFFLGSAPVNIKIGLENAGLNQEFLKVVSRFSGFFQPVATSV